MSVKTRVGKKAPFVQRDERGKIVQSSTNHTQSLLATEIPQGAEVKVQVVVDGSVVASSGVWVAKVKRNRVAQARVRFHVTDDAAPPGKNQPLVFPEGFEGGS